MNHSNAECGMRNAECGVWSGRFVSYSYSVAAVYDRRMTENEINKSALIERRYRMEAVSIGPCSAREFMGLNSRPKIGGPSYP